MKDNLDKLDEFIAKQKLRWNVKNKITNTNIFWAADSHYLGDRGNGWLQGSGNSAKVIFHEVGKINKLKGNIPVTDMKYQNFMKAYFMRGIDINKPAPSASKLRSINLLLRQLYYSLVKTTGQTNPIYLSNEVFRDAMNTVAEAKKNDQTNLKNSGIALQKIGREIDSLNMTLTKIEFTSTYGAHNTSNTSKAQKAIDIKLAEEGMLNTSEPDDEKDKLIAMRTFLNIITLIHQVEDTGEVVMLNLLLLLIITGFRFDEGASLAEDAIERELIEGDALKLCQRFNLPEYNLKINYLGLKGSKQKVHYIEPHAITLVEAIFDSVRTLTAPFRDILRQQRADGFKQFLPRCLQDIKGDMISLDDMCEHLITTSATVSGDWSYVRDKAKKAFNSIGLKPVLDEKTDDFLSRNTVFYSKSDINKAYFNYARNKKNFIKDDQAFIKIRAHQKAQYPIEFERLLFIIPVGASSMSRNRVYRNLIANVTISEMSRFLGSASGTSIFMKYELIEDDGSPSKLLTNMPRHNVNTFLAVAGITDHLQAMLMGRRDIKQNQHYQHLSLAQTLPPPLPAVFEGFDKHQSNTTTDSKGEVCQLSPFEANNPPIDQNEYSDNLGTDLDELFSDTLSEMEMTNPVEYTKVTGVMVFDTEVSLENNFKKSLHTFGDKDENAKYLADMISGEFMPELNDAYSELMSNGEEEKAKELLRRHAELSPLILGSCTRNLAQWGCPFGAKCVNGEECGYHAMTGRSGELETIVKHLLDAKESLKQLEKLARKDNSFADSLDKARESYKSLESMKAKSQEALAKGTIVSLISKPTPEQLGAFRKPTALVDYFAIEHERLKKVKAVKDSEKNKDIK